ncbi:MAG: hypothetical protein JWR85_2500 [Marmoricola sp.]|nr:hypothetical protein [Marmoricola sp.]
MDDGVLDDGVLEDRVLEDGVLEDGAVTYEQWGVDFFLEAISEERLLGAVNSIAGQGIDFGPIGAGPGGIAKVRAYGEIGDASATRLAGDQIAYRVLLPVSLTFEVDLQIEKQQFDAELLVPLTLSAVARSRVRILIEATPPRAEDVQVELKARGLRASVLQRVVGIEGELRRFVARYVAKELDKPHVREARTIDVRAAIGQAWTSISAGKHQDDRVTADLNEALEREIRDHENAFVGDLPGEQRHP